MVDKKRKVATAAADRPQKKSKKAIAEKPTSDVQSTVATPVAEVETSQNTAAVKSKAGRKRAADFLEDETKTAPVASDASVQVEKPKKKPKKIAAAATQSAASKTGRKTRSSTGASLTADGVNGIIEHGSDSEVEIATGDVPVETSLEAEALHTADKELADEFGQADSDDEDVDQGAALLAGFDSDNEDVAEDTNMDLTRTQPIPDYKKTSKKLRKAKENGSTGPGSVYVGRIPHGFYEQPMRDYFSQFGDIKRLRLSRNRRTGASKHFAFIEFESDEVAKIVAETMDNYLMFGHILKCKYAPTENLHPDVWKGANKKFRKIPHEKLERQKLEAPKSVEQWEKKNAKEQKKRNKKAEKLKTIGYEINVPALKEPSAIVEQRMLDAPAEQPAITNGEVVENVTQPEPEVKETKKSKKTKGKADGAAQVAPLTEDNLDVQNADNAIENAKTGKKGKKATKAQKAPSTTAATNAGSVVTDDKSTTKKKKKAIEAVTDSETTSRGDLDALSSLAVGAEAIDAEETSAPAAAMAADLNNLATISGVADAELKKRKKDRKNLKADAKGKSKKETAQDEVDVEVSNIAPAAQEANVKAGGGDGDNVDATSAKVAKDKKLKGILKKGKKGKA